MTTNNSAVAVKSISRDELDTPVTWEEASAFHGITDKDVFVASIYTVLNKDKDALLEVPFIIRKVSFKAEERFASEFAIIHLVTKYPVKGASHFVMTDGSTGICAQLMKLVDERIADGHPTPDEGIVIANGLRKSDYLIAEGENAGQPATTYYLA